MFLFFHSAQTDLNSNYYKGRLFEELLGKYLEASGYAVTIRAKHNSLEYDLDGVHKVDHRKVIGEAKAHGKNISGEIITSFIGKLAPFWLKNSNTRSEKVSGIFLSTSDLTPEADDYLRALPESTVTVLCGNQLITQISTILHLPKTETLEQNVQARGFFPLSNHLLMSILSKVPG